MSELKPEHLAEFFVDMLEHVMWVSVEIMMEVKPARCLMELWLWISQLMIVMSTFISIAQCLICFADLLESGDIAP